MIVRCAESIKAQLCRFSCEDSHLPRSSAKDKPFLKSPHRPTLLPGTFPKVCSTAQTQISTLSPRKRPDYCRAKQEKTKQRKRQAHAFPVLPQYRRNMPRGSSMQAFITPARQHQSDIEASSIEPLQAFEHISPLLLGRLDLRLCRVFLLLELLLHLLLYQPADRLPVVLHERNPLLPLVHAYKLLGQHLALKVVAL